MLDLVIQLKVVFPLGNAPAETVVISTFGGGFARPYSVVVAFVVLFGPLIVVSDWLGFLLLVGQRRANDAVDVVEVHGTDFLLGVFGQD